MRILHLIDSGGIYGAENVLVSLMKAQRDLANETVLGSIGDCASGVKEIEQVANAAQIPVQPFRMRKGPNLFGNGISVNPDRKKSEILGDPITSFANGAFVVATIGRLSPEKNHRVLLASLKENGQILNCLRPLGRVFGNLSKQASPWMGQKAHRNE